MRQSSPIISARDAVRIRGDSLKPTEHAPATDLAGARECPRDLGSAPATVRVLLAPIARLAASPVGAALLAPEERARLARITHEGAREAFLAGRVLARRALGDLLGLAPADVPLALGPLGKPMLAGARPVPFSLAHGRISVALAIGSHGPVGVDVEAVDATRDLPAIARTVFSDPERAALAAAGHGADVFFRIWTAKEAVAKATGTGLSADPRGFGLEGPPPEPGGGPAPARDHAGARWWVLAHRVGAEIVAVAIGRADAVLVVEMRDA